VVFDNYEEEEPEEIEASVGADGTEHVGDNDPARMASAKKAEAADNEYNIDAAGDPVSKETGKSPTVECHEKYDTQQSKGAASVAQMGKKADTADNPANEAGGEGAMLPKTDREKAKTAKDNGNCSVCGCELTKDGACPRFFTHGNKKKADTADNPYNMKDGQGAPDNKKSVEKADTAGPVPVNTKTAAAASPELKEKLHPQRFSGMSGKMAAIVGFIVGETYTDPHITEMAVTSDGMVLAQQSGDVGMNDMVGSETDLQNNWKRLCEAAGLDAKEMKEANALFKSKIVNYRTGPEQGEPWQTPVSWSGTGTASAKQADGVQKDFSEAKSETVSPDTVDPDIEQPTVSVEEAGKVGGLKVALMFMNRYEIEDAVRRFERYPVLGKAARFLKEFMDEVDSHSDGWAYWGAPVAAAKKLMELLQYEAPSNGEDVDEEKFRKALAPIRAFMTRRGLAAGMQMPKVGSSLTMWVRRIMAADISGDMSEAEALLDYSKGEMAGDPEATDTVNPEHFAGDKQAAMSLQKIVEMLDGEIEQGGHASPEQIEAANYLRGMLGQEPKRYEPGSIPGSEPKGEPKGEGMVVHVPSGAQLMPDNKAWTNRMQIKSESSDKLYTIAQSKHGRFWACSCPGWIHWKRCKHLTALGLPSNYQPYEAQLKQGSKEAAAGDEFPEEAPFDFGAGDLADIILTEDTDGKE
jgi:hypothetical protein